MIIDKILDRKDGNPYGPKRFYDDVVMYGEVGFAIAEAMDSGEEADVEKELCRYLVDNDYRMSIGDYINSVNWLS